MALSEEEKAQLDALIAKDKEEPPEDEYIEIWDESGKGAKVKRSSAKSWLNQFGIDVDEAAPEEGDAKDTKGSKPAKTAKRDTPTSEGTATRYFGNRRAG